MGGRLYRLRFFSGLVLSLPFLAGSLWYAWSTLAGLDRYRRAIEPAQVINAELFQIALHDELERDLLRLRQPERPVRDALPTYSLSLTRASLDALAKGPKGEGEASYVDGLLERGGAIHEVKVRYRGDQPWHRFGAQRSLKVRADKGDLIDGVRVFNLLNDPTPFGLEDQLILDLARDTGLLAPDYRPVRVRLNNLDLGVYRFEAQPDESLLRRARRIPGNMYSGDTDEVDTDKGVGALFLSSKGWQKIGSRDAEHEADRRELDRLLGQVNHGSYEAFARYAEEELDLARYALFDALDVVFGGSEHDYLSNHKLYADPYRGRLEPVAWSFRGFRNDPAFNLVDHPLLCRLKATPFYLARRDREVYNLLTGRASVPEIRGRADQAMAALAGELAADPFWDAYKQLPRLSRLHRFLLRPMTLERWALHAAYELDGFQQRSRYLLDALERPGLSVSSKDLDRVDLTISDHAAYRVRTVWTNASCVGTFSLVADADLDGRWDAAKDVLVAEGPLGENVEVTSYATLAPRAVLVPHPDPSTKQGRVRVETEPTVFTYFLRTTGCAPEGAALVLESLVSSASTKVELGKGSRAVPEQLARAITEVPRLSAGERSPHPWSYPQPPPAGTLHLGPGVVPFPEGLSTTQKVEVAAGTTLALGPGASLVFFGQVLVHGTSNHPVRVVRLEPKEAFGGVALQGPATAGSRVRGIVLEGGSEASHPSIEYGALFNVHDTRDVTIEGATFAGSTGTGDVVHAYQVQKLELSDLSIDKAPVDAVDLEYVAGSIRGLRVAGAGDDCLDLMGVALRVQDSSLIGCTNNGISAGEESSVTTYGVLIARAKTGVLAKNASELRLIRSLIAQTSRGLRARRDEIRYGGKSRIGVSEVFVVGAERVADADGRSTIEVDQIRTELPDDGELNHLLEQAGGLKSWSELEERLRGLEAAP